MSRYAVPFLIVLLTKETLIHIMHVVAIKDVHARVKQHDSCPDFKVP